MVPVRTNLLRLEREDVRRSLADTLQPIYVSLSNLLKAEIEEGRLVGGQRLPSIAQLAELYSVARVTVRQALGVLGAAGIVETAIGKGTFVANRPNTPETIELDSNWQELLAALDRNSPQLIESNDDCDLPEHGRGNGRSLKSYRYMKRIHSNDNRPYCVNEVYLANDYYKLAKSSFETQMVISVLSRIAGSELKQMNQSVRIISSDLFTSSKLKLPLNTPLCDVRRVITSRSGDIVYFARGKYRGDLVVFNTTIKVPKR
jgi:GntR family transcriptional regulator